MVGEDFVHLLLARYKVCWTQELISDYDQSPLINLKTRISKAEDPVVMAVLRTIFRPEGLVDWCSYYESELWRRPEKQEVGVIVFGSILAFVYYRSIPIVHILLGKFRKFHKMIQKTPRESVEKLIWIFYPNHPECVKARRESHFYLWLLVSRDKHGPLSSRGRARSHLPPKIKNNPVVVCIVVVHSVGDFFPCPHRFNLIIWALILFSNTALQPTALFSLLHDHENVCFLVDPLVGVQRVRSSRLQWSWWYVRFPETDTIVTQPCTLPP